MPKISHPDQVLMNVRPRRSIHEEVDQAQNSVQAAKSHRDFDSLTPFCNVELEQFISQRRDQIYESALLKSSSGHESHAILKKFPNHVRGEEVGCQRSSIINSINPAGTLDSLNEREYQFRSFFKSSPEGFVLADEEGSIIEWNWMMEKLTGLNISKVIGKPIWDVYSMADFQIKGGPDALLDRGSVIRDLCNRGHESWQSELHEMAIKDTSGQGRAVQVAMFPIKADGGFMLGGIFRDITSQRSAYEPVSSIAAEPEAASMKEESRLPETACKSGCEVPMDDVSVELTEARGLKLDTPEGHYLCAISSQAKNNLQMLSGFMKNSPEEILEEKNSKALLERQNRTRSVALIYEVLSKSPDPEKIAFADYIALLADTIAQSQEISPMPISFKLKNDDAMLRLESAIPCGLIINELISDSLKHAFPGGQKGEICIEFRSLGASIYMLSISGNGIAQVEETAAENGGIGLLQRLCPLIEEIDGQIMIDKDRGNRIDVCFNELKYDERLKRAQAELHRAKGKSSRG